MKITRLHLQQFGCWQNQQFEFVGRKVLIVGPNAAGKSTVLDAIAWLFTGRCRGLDGAGRGVKDVLLNKAGEAMAVSANVVIGNDTFQVTRTFSGSGTGFAVKAFRNQAGDWQGGTEDQERAWFDHLKMTRESLLLMLDGETFLHLEHADAKTLLLEFLQTAITGPSTGEIISLTECEKRYNDAFDARKTAKREFGKRTKPTEPGPVGDISAVRKKLETYTQQRDDFNRQLGAIQAGALSESDVQRARLREELKACHGRLAGQVEDWPEWIADAEEEFAKATKTLAEYQEPGSPVANLEQIRKHDPEKHGCVLNKDIPCDTKLTQFAVFYRKHKDDKPAKHSLSKATLVNDLDSAKESLKARQESVAKWTVAKARVAEIEAELSALDDKAAEADPGAGETLAGLEKAIAEITESIRKGQDILNKKLSLEEAHKRYLPEKESYEKLETDIAKYEADVELYGPKGIRATALAQSIGEWTEGINAALEPFGYEVAISIDPWGFVVNGQPTARLSTSERLRLATALQVATAIHSKVGFTMIDSLDWLLTAPRKILSAVLNRSKLEQVILAKAQEPDAAQAPLAGDTQVIPL